MKYSMSRLTTQQKIANARSNGRDFTVHLGNGGSITYHADGSVTKNNNASTLNADSSNTIITGSMTRQDIGKDSTFVTSTIGSHAVKSGTGEQTTTYKHTDVPSKTADVDTVVNLGNITVHNEFANNSTNTQQTDVDVDVVVDLNADNVKNNENTLGVDVVVDLNAGVNMNDTKSIGTAAYTNGKVYAEADVNGNLVNYVKLQTTKDIKASMPVATGVSESVAYSTSEPAINGVSVLSKNQNTSDNTDADTIVESVTAINGVKLTDKSTEDKTTNTDGSTIIETVGVAAPAINGVCLTKSDKYQEDTYPTDKTTSPIAANTWLFGTTVARTADTNGDANTYSGTLDTTTTNNSNAVAVSQQTEKTSDVISWDTEQIQQHITKLKSVTADMENARNSLKALREQVVANWTGTAATTYLAEMSIDLDDFKVFIDNVGVLESALNTVLHIFTDCETSVTSSMKTLDAQLNTLQSQSVKTVAMDIQATKSV